MLEPPAIPKAQLLPAGIVTFLFTDIVGSTELKGLVPAASSFERDRIFRERVKGPHDVLVKACCAARGGVCVKSTGDGFLFAFPDAEAAVTSALEIQEALSACPIETPKKALAVRIGLHTGSAAPHGDDYAAAAADKAARVQSRAEGGQVLVSRETHALVLGKLHGVGFSSLGVLELKGIGQDEVYVTFRVGRNPFLEKEHAYRRHLIDALGKLTLYSVTSDQPLAVDLEQVFVKLSVISRKSERARQLFISHDASTNVEELLQKIDPQQLERAALTEMIQLGRYEANAPLPVAAVIERHPHLAILGSPGAGKTTLLKWIALTFARRETGSRLGVPEERLPVIVALRDFNRFIDNLAARGELPSPLPPSLLARYCADYFASHHPHLDLPRDFFTRALSLGACIVLLDGLDEIADRAKRVRAAEFIATCIQSTPANRFVVTSRPRGYEADCRSILTPVCSEASIRDFTRADIEEFARSWYLAVPSALWPALVRHRR